MPLSGATFVGPFKFLKKIIPQNIKIIWLYHLVEQDQEDFVTAWRLI